MTVTQEDILHALKNVQDPDLHRDIVALGFVQNVQVLGGDVSFTIELTTPACPVKDQMKEQAVQHVGAIPGVKSVKVAMTSQVRAAGGSGPARGTLAPQIKNIVPIASGKGGVGKSTISVNLALALAKTGARVGLMDADVYGPSVPAILGIVDVPEVTGRRIVPVEQHGIKVISMGFFMKPEEAVVWRGPMLHKTIEQFLGSVEWGELDYLLVDLPPGTGDVQLSLCQLISITGAVVVSTPQDVALNVAQKAIAMFNKLRAPVIGIIENMSEYVCPSCGHREEIFGHGGAKQTAERLNIPFLGEIPLTTKIRLASDNGVPLLISDPADPAAKAFTEIAGRLAAQVSIRAMQGEQVKVSF